MEYLVGLFCGLLIGLTALLSVRYAQHRALTRRRKVVVVLNHLATEDADMHEMITDLFSDDRLLNQIERKVFGDERV